MNFWLETINANTDLVSVVSVGIKHPLWRSEFSSTRDRSSISVHVIGDDLMTMMDTMIVE